MIKNLPAMQKTRLIPGLGIFPGEGNDYPLQYSGLENPWTEGPGKYGPWGHKESDTTFFHVISLCVY